MRFVVIEGVIYTNIDMSVFNPEITPRAYDLLEMESYYDEMFKLLKFVFKNYSVTSADIVEFNPLNDINEKTAELVLEWLFKNRNLVGGLEWSEEPDILKFFFGKLKAKGNWPEKFEQDFGDSL